MIGFRTFITEQKIGPVYHGTDRKFDKFEIGHPTASGVESNGIFFTKSMEVAAGYGDTVIAANIKMEDEVTFDFRRRSRFDFDGKSRSPSELLNRIKEISDDLEKGYGLPEEHESDLIFELQDAGWDPSVNADYIDGIIMKNVDDSMTAFGGKVTDHYVVFSQKQIRRLK